MNIELPNEYVVYAETDGVSEACTEGNPGYFALWHPDEIEANNQNLDIASRAPGFLGFGTDGGGELLVFDATGAVFMLPLVGMEPKHAQRIADSWNEVVQRITRRV